MLQSKLTESSGLNGYAFFNRSPFRDASFLASTVVLAFIILLSVVLVAWGEMPSGTALSLVAALCFILLPWIFALRIHDRIQTPLGRQPVEGVQQGSPLDAALGAVAEMIGWGLGFAFAGALILLSILIALIRFH